MNAPGHDFDQSLSSSPRPTTATTATTAAATAAVTAVATVAATAAGQRQNCFSCTFCGKKFTSRSRLLGHKNYVHHRRRPYSCELCDRHFNASFQKFAHLHRDHVQRDCMTPSAAGGTHSNGATGLSVRGQVEPEGQSDDDLLQLIAYVPALTDCDYVCAECDQIFYDANELVLHLISAHHSDESKEEEFACSFCKESFPAAKWLSAHVKYRHGNEKTYSCKTCKQEFDSSSSQVLHEHLACPELKVQCSACPARLRSVGEYYDHVRAIHSQ